MSVENDLRVGQRERKSVWIRYRNATGKASERSIDVYEIGRGYVSAFDGLRGERRTFRISRVQWTMVSDHHFDVPDDMEPNEWVATGTGSIE